MKALLFLIFISLSVNSIKCQNITINEVRKLYSANEIDHAYTLANDLLKFDSLNSELYNIKAICEIRRNEFLKGLSSIRMSLKLDSTNIKNIITAGVVFSFNDLIDSSAYYFKKALIIDSLNPIIYLNRGGTFYFHRANELALTNYNSALKLNPKDGFIYYNIALIYFDESAFLKAIEFLKKANNLELNDAEINYLLARCYYEVGSYKKSIRYFSKTKKHMKYYDKSNQINIKYLYRYIGMAYILTGKIRQGERYLSISSNIYGDSSD